MNSHIPMSLLRPIIRQRSNLITTAEEAASFWSWFISLDLSTSGERAEFWNATIVSRSSHLQAIQKLERLTDDEFRQILRKIGCEFDRNNLSSFIASLSVENLNTIWRWQVQDAIRFPEVTPSRYAAYKPLTTKILLGLRNLWATLTLTPLGSSKSV